MKRIILMVFRNLIWVPYGWFKLCWCAAHVDRYSEKERYELLQYIDNRAIRGGNIKIEAYGLENIPKENGFMVFACMKALMIDREDIKQSMQVILQVIKEVKEGRNYLIFAEGTRNKDENRPHEFKGGSFKAATKSRCPIVPVALIDSYKAFDTRSIEKMVVQVHFLEPMYYDEYKDMKTTELALEVKTRIEETIKKSGKWD